MVSVTLVVVVSLVSMMIYSVGTIFIFGLAAVMIGIAVLGDWIIYRTAPVEPKTHKRNERSRTQAQMLRMARVLLPAAAIVGAAAALFSSIGAGLVAAAVSWRRWACWRSSTTSTSTSRTATSRRSCERWGRSSAPSARR